MAQQGLVKVKGKENAAGPMSIFELFLCGGLAGAANSTIVTPVELIRNRLMVQYHTSTTEVKPQYSGPFDAMKQIIRLNGISGMWKGQMSTLSRDVLGVGCFYAGNDAAKRWLLAHTDLPGTSLSLNLCAGALAGISYWSAALPLDTMKSVIQTDFSNKSPFLLIQEKVAKEGIISLWRGWPVAFTRGIPGAAVTFTVYGEVHRYLTVVS
jgi:hypothetical protein